ncbi:Ig-like domain-containing protein [Paenibacillus sp. BSR1-1]|uniref:Ig-like domain-containing protein n=1 Tax=Paenibacillus sp. BSR1-1 TaxID=3020845 RepID=UPI0025AF6000|nr:Ig-like domain-containing protein [Paenibacillus sp. BSR1-1]MDN3019207.1 Ig-like domain-containing protein [Paenibacillus sp. BSR1-1]
MRKLLIYLIAIAVFLGVVPSYKEAETIATEPQLQVKLRNFLGNPSSISLKIVGSYYLNEDPANLLTNDRSYTVRVEDGTLGLYDGTTKLASGSNLSITPVKSNDHAFINNREYAGSFLFTVEEEQFVRPINTINLEDYVKSVVPYEMWASWGKEALKAQAVAARTYAYYRLNQVINDTTTFQVYGGVTGQDSRTSEAVDETEGQILTYNGKVIDAVFSASNGGKTENQFNVKDPISLPYFKVQTDEYDTTLTWNAILHKQQIDVTSLDLKDPESWWESTNEIDAVYTSNIKKWMLNYLPGLSGKQIKIVGIPKVSFYEQTESGRFSKSNLSLEFFVKDVINSTGELELQTVNINNQLADNMRSIISSKDLTSNLFSIDETEDAFVFSGSGNGHGVGLSQHGANHRAAAGILYKDILSFYYPGTILTKQYAIPPEPVKVNGVTDKDTIVTGTAEAGSTVEVKVNGSMIGSGTAGTAGKFAITIPIQKAGTELVFTATDKGGNVSEGTTVAVKDVTAPSKPVVNVVTDKDNSVTGETEAGAKVEVKVEGALIGNGESGPDGKFTVTIPVQKDGTELALTATDKVGNVSETTIVVVKDGTAPVKPVVNEVTDKDTSVTGQTEAGSKVEVKVNGTVIGTGFAGEDGKFTVTIPVQKAGTELVLSAVDKAGNISEVTTVAVKDVTAPSQPVVNVVTNKDTTVTGNAEAGSKVEVNVNGTVIGTGTVQADGKFSVSILVQKKGTEMIVTVTDLAGNRSEGTRIIVTAKSGWVKENGIWHYYDLKTGEEIKGWFNEGTKWYYFDQTGAMKTGWLQLGTTWYYFDQAGAMKTGWQQLGATWYYFKSSRAMQTGWLQLGTTWYYFKGNGAMQTGWLKSGSKWYYFNTSGAMQTGKVKIYGKWYTFDKNGVMK